MAVAGWEVGLELAEEKGPAPIMNDEFKVTPQMLRLRPEMKQDGYKVGDRVLGRVLHARYSRYMQKVAEVAPELVARMAEQGARLTHHTSIAPTGTISLSLANNTSNGIEPSFAHHYNRNVIREGRKSKERVSVYSYELLAYRTLVNPAAMPYSEDPAEQLPDDFVTAESISPKEHVAIQAAAHKWIDSSISKTANVPTDYPYEDFKDEHHFKRIGLLEPGELSAQQQLMLNEKRAQVEARDRQTQQDADTLSDPAGEASYPDSATLCFKCSTKAMVLLDGWLCRYEFTPF